MIGPCLHNSSRVTAKQEAMFWGTHHLIQEVLTQTLQPAHRTMRTVGFNPEGNSSTHHLRKGALRG